MKQLLTAWQGIKKPIKHLICLAFVSTLTDCMVTSLSFFALGTDKLEQNPATRFLYSHGFGYFGPMVYWPVEFLIVASVSVALYWMVHYALSLLKQMPSFLKIFCYAAVYYAPIVPFLGASSWVLYFLGIH